MKSWKMFLAQLTTQSTKKNQSRFSQTVLRGNVEDDEKKNHINKKKLLEKFHNLFVLMKSCFNIFC